MAAKVLFVFCSFAFIIQSALGQCLGRMAGMASNAPYRSGFGFDGHAYDSLGMEGIWPKRAGCSTIIPAPELAASCGGGLSVSSSSATAPTGLAVTSENVYEGPVAVTGNLPFLGTAAMEGVFSTGGTGVINYGCGDGAVAITAESPVDAAIAPAAIASAAIAPTTIAAAATSPAAISSSMSPWGFRGFQPRGCGCGAPSLY